MTTLQRSFSALLALVATGLQAELADLTPSYNVKRSQGEYRFDNSKTDYAALKWKSTVAAGKYYLLEFRASTEKNGELSVDLRGFPEKSSDLFGKYTVSTGTELYRVYFYSPAAAELTCRIFTGNSIKLSGLRLRELQPAELARLETGSLNDQFYFLRRPTGATLESVNAKDSLEGGKAVRYTLLAPDGTALTSRDFPLQPNGDYELSFWCKGTAGLLMNVRIDGWASGRKHWYLTREFKLENNEYLLYRIPFRTPDDVNRFLGRGRLILTLKTTQATIEIKGLTLIRKIEKK